MFSRQFSIKCTDSRGHTTIIEGPNLFCQKSSSHSPKKKTSFKSFTYYNWNCFQFEQNQNSFSAFLLNSRHLEFQISSTQSKFLDLLKRTLFTLKIVSKRIFSENGGKRVRACADPAGPAPPHSPKKLFLKRFSM